MTTNFSVYRYLNNKVTLRTDFCNDLFIVIYQSRTKNRTFVPIFLFFSFLEFCNHISFLLFCFVSKSDPVVTFKGANSHMETHYELIGLIEGWRKPSTHLKLCSIVEWKLTGLGWEF